MQGTNRKLAARNQKILKDFKLLTHSDRLRNHKFASSVDCVNRAPCLSVVKFTLEGACAFLAFLIFVSIAGPSNAFSNHAVSEALYGFYNSNGAIIKISSSADQIKAKIVIVGRKKRGEEMEVSYHMHFENLPSGKKYNLYFLTGYMEKTGEAEVNLYEELEGYDGARTPDERGNLEPLGQYNALLYRGEWIQLRLRSTDRTVEKEVRFTPYK